MLYLFIAGDMILVFLLSMITNRFYHLPIWKLIVFTLTIGPIGLLCGKLMRLVEEGTMEGVSYYGALLFAPIPMVLVGLLLHIKAPVLLDFCAPAGCVALVFMKIQCLITDCCYGRILYYHDNGRPVRFPSQIVEMGFGIILLIVIMLLIRTRKLKGLIYPWFLLLYGFSRFFLNLLRDTQPFVFGLSAGCFWSIIAVLIGTAVLAFGYRGRLKSHEI